MEHFFDDPLDVVSSKSDSTSLKEIFVLFICEVKEVVLSLTSAHSYYSFRDKAIEAKKFYNTLHCNPNFVYQVFNFPVE